MSAKCSMCDGKGIVTTQTICDCKKLPVPPPARDWKPERGEAILAKCMYLGFAPGCNDIVRVRFGDIDFSVPLSSIHPMTGRDGGK